MGSLGTTGARAQAHSSLRIRVVFTVVITLALLVSGTTFRQASGGGTSALPHGLDQGAPSLVPELANLLDGPRTAISDAAADLPLPSSIALHRPDSVALHVLIALRPSNASTFASLLANASSGSGATRPFLSAGSFVDRFAPSVSSYDTLVAYLRSFPGVAVTTFPGRGYVALDGPSSAVGAAFGTSIESFAGPGGIYGAPERGPSLPASLASRVAGVVGLGTGPNSLATVPAGGYAHFGSGALSDGRVEASASRAASGLPPSPVSIGGTQYVYPTDLQVGYDEQSLFALYGSPVSGEVASVVWDGTYSGANRSTGCGALTDGQSVGPFDSQDFAAFFNETSPSGQPHPSLVPVPIAGALPGCLASWDTSGTVVANTAELEAVGSTAPGATVWGVSVPAPTVSDLETAVAAILEPWANLSSGIKNVSVLDLGWALSDRSDSTWSALLNETVAKGITVVAPTGDSGDNASSSAWTGADASFPSSAATNNSGSLAVGGTSIVLNPSNLHIASEVAWYSPSATAGATRGSSGGTSTFYPEPSWQATSRAAPVIAGAGRGVPDLAAMANNSLVTVSIDGARWNASNATLHQTRFVSANGTAVAAALVAGLLVTTDHALTAENGLRVGFVNPLLYILASQEYTPLPNGTTIGHVQGLSTYTSSLPTLPFRDVTSGRNAAHRALAGYDLVTGWGSLDAYNFTMYLAPTPQSPTWGRLQGVEAFVNLTNLVVTSTFPGGAPSPSTSASVQENFFVANALGAPVYWVQSVTTLEYATATHSWTTDYQGWVVLPFWGLYPRLAVYEFDVPPTVTTSMPLALTLKSVLLPGTVASPPQVQFSFGGPGATTLELPLPGASYIIGNAAYSYNWQGTNFTNGPNGSGAGGSAGFLAPQVGIVGYPGGAVATFQSGTSAAVSALVQPLSTLTLLKAGTGLVDLSTTQTGETAVDLGYTATSSSSYSLAYNAGVGTSEQGIYLFEVPRFTVRFTQTGVPSRSTWYVNITGNQVARASALGSISSLSFQLPNGTYQWSGGINVRGWSSIPRGGPLTVSGTPITISLQFGQSTSTVTFLAIGPPTGAPLPFSWSVSVVGGANLSGSTTKLTTSVLYGTYTFTVSDTNTTWRPSKSTATFLADTATTLVYVRFVLVTYLCEIVFQLPGGISPHMIVRIGTHSAAGYFSTYSAHMTNGSHPWSVSQLSGGDTASPTNGTFVVHGPGPTKGKYVAVVTITAPPSNGLFGLGPYGYLIVGGAIAAAALLVVLMLLRRRRRKAAGEEPTEERAEKPRKPSRRKAQAWDETFDQE